MKATFNSETNGPNGLPLFRQSKQINLSQFNLISIVLFNLCYFFIIFLYLSFTNNGPNGLPLFRQSRQINLSQFNLISIVLFNLCYFFIIFFILKFY